MTDNPITRVRYFEQQFLRMQDFTDEQAYLLAMRRRHNIAQHIWGIVDGLELSIENDTNLVVAKGVAIDGFGRELILAERQALSLISAFDDKESETLDVWLEYRRTEADKAPPGYVSSCKNGSGNAFYRWQEQPLVRLEKPEPGSANPRQPRWVPEADLNFQAYNTPPDDPQQRWPVFLGQVARNPAGSDQPPYSVDPANRPYVRLRGEYVSAPSGRAAVQIGAEVANSPRRFAVLIPEANLISPSFEIDRTGQIDMRGDTTVHGNLSIKGFAVVLEAGTARSPDAPPWRIYHIEKEGTDETPVDGPPAEPPQNGNGQAAEQKQVVEHQLRIEMPAGTEGQNSVVIGAWSAEDEIFNPVLTVADNGIVTIQGNLIVKGSITGAITEARPRAAARLSDEAKRFLQSGILSGVGGASLQLQKFYRRLGLTQPGSPDQPGPE